MAQAMYAQMAFTKGVNWTSQLQDIKAKATPKSLTKIVAHLEKRLEQLRAQVFRVNQLMQSLFELMTWLYAQIESNAQVDLGTLVVPFKQDALYKDARQKQPESQKAVTLQKHLTKDFEGLQEMLQWQTQSLTDLEKQEP